MSAIGTKRTCTSAPHMSAFGGKAEIILGGDGIRTCRYTPNLHRGEGDDYSNTTDKNNNNQCGSALLRARRYARD